MVLYSNCSVKITVFVVLVLLSPLVQSTNAVVFPENGLPRTADMPAFNLTIEMSLPRGYARSEGRHEGNLRSKVDARLSEYVSSHVENFLRERWVMSSSSLFEGPQIIEVELEFVTGDESRQRRNRRRRAEGGGAFVDMEILRSFEGQLLLWFSSASAVSQAIEKDLLDLTSLLNDAFTGDAESDFLQRIKDGDQALDQVGVMAFSNSVTIAVETGATTMIFDPTTTTPHSTTAAVQTGNKVENTFVNGTADVPPFTLHLNVGIPSGYLESGEFNSHSNRKEEVDERLATYASSHLDNWLLRELEKREPSSLTADLWSLDVELEVVEEKHDRQRRLQIHDRSALFHFLVARSLGGTVRVSVNSTGLDKNVANQQLVVGRLSELLASKNEAFEGNESVAFLEYVTAGEQSLPDGEGILTYITEMNLTDGVVVQEDVPQDSGAASEPDGNAAGNGDGRPNFASAVSPEVEEEDVPPASSGKAARVGIILGALFLPFASGMVVGTLSYILCQKMRKKRENEEDAILEEKKEQQVEAQPQEAAVAGLPDSKDSW